MQLPYFFLFCFSVITIVAYPEKVTAKLTEGITLLQSLSIIYWALDYGIANIDNWFAKAALILCILLSLFSILQALTYHQLTRSVRLTLSIWSTIIMLIFATDYIYRVYHYEYSDTSGYASVWLFGGLQFFLLGVSAVYIAQNYILLAGFLPGKNGNYKHDLMELKNDHIKRYSEKQVYIGHSVLCILYAAIVYGLNYKYHFLPRHTMIWLVLWTFPWLLHSMTLLQRRAI